MILRLRALVITPERKVDLRQDSEKKPLSERDARRILRDGPLKAWDPLRTPGFRKLQAGHSPCRSKATGEPKEFAVQIHTRDHSQFGK
jgi:hypothetical protein